MSHRGMEQAIPTSRQFCPRVQQQIISLVLPNIIITPIPLPSVISSLSALTISSSANTTLSSPFLLPQTYNSKQKAMSLVFHSQPIINKGQTLSCIYKLLRGSAAVLDSQGNPRLLLKPPLYLNLPEAVYEAPATKTIRAERRCEVLKVRVKDAHKRVIKGLKDSGLRKSRFPLFQAVPSPFFYSLMLHAKVHSLEKAKFTDVLRGSLYLVVQGSLFVCRDGRSKLLKLQQGQTLMVSLPGTSIFPQTDHVRIAQVPTATAELLLGEHYQKIKRHGDSQKDLLQSYETRNARLTADLKHSRDGESKDRSHQSEFGNKIIARVERFQQYKRARSCFSVCRLDRKEILQKNQQKYLELVDQNRKRLGQEHVYRKRLEVGRYVHSLSHGKSLSQVTQSQGQEDQISLNARSPALSHHKQSHTLNDGDSCIFENFTLKSQYSALKHQPELKKPRKEGLVRRTAALKRTFISHHGSRANSGQKATP